MDQYIGKWVLGIVLVMLSVLGAKEIADLRARVSYLEERVLVESGAYLQASGSRRAHLQQHPLHEEYEQKVRKTREQGLKNAVVAYATKRLRTNMPEYVVREAVEAAFSCAATYGVDPLIVVAMVQQESWFNPHAVGPHGERGLMQLTRTVAEMYGLDWSEAFDIWKNVCVGVRYYADLKARERGDHDRALQRYNGGWAYVQAVYRRLSGVHEHIRIGQRL